MGLHGRGMAAEDVRQLFRFIDWIMELPPALEERFRDEMTGFDQERGMPFIDVFERTGIEKGLKEGLGKGLLEGIEACLEVKFGAAARELMPEVREIRDHKLLRRVLGGIKAAAGPDDLRRAWARKSRSKAAKPE